MRSILLASAALLIIAPATMAQSPTPANPPAQNQASHNSDPNGATAEPQHIRANLRSALEKAGYKDIRVSATSFMVRAKDSEGNPVMMSISPDSFTEISEVGANSNAGSTTGTSNNAASGGTFVSVPEADELSSKVVGLDIYNNDNKDIGQIKDIALNPNGRSQAFIVSVGGSSEWESIMWP